MNYCKRLSERLFCWRKGKFQEIICKWPLYSGLEVYKTLLSRDYGHSWIIHLSLPVHNVRSASFVGTFFLPFFPNFEKLGVFCQDQATARPSFVLGKLKRESHGLFRFCFPSSSSSVRLCTAGASFSERYSWTNVWFTDSASFTPGTSRFKRLICVGPQFSFNKTKKRKTK